MKNKLTALLLALALLAGLPAAAVYAEEDSAACTETDGIIFDGGSVFETELSDGSETDLLYESETETTEETFQESTPETEALQLSESETAGALLEVESEDASPEKESAGQTSVETAAAANTDAARETAVLAIRQAMHDRVTDFTIHITTESMSSTAARNLALKLYNEAMAHTGVPDEGDYIMWHRGTAFSAEIQNLVRTDDQSEFDIAFHQVYTSDMEMEAAVDAAVENLLANELNLDGLEDYEKAYEIYHYICEHVDYVSDGTLTQHSAYAAFIKGGSVCQGYALMFYRLALASGLSVRLVPGTTGSGQSHGWNIVKIGDLYYNLDSTWDAGKKTYDYFLVGSELFTGHFRRSDYKTSAFNEAYPTGKAYAKAEDEAHHEIFSTAVSVGEEGHSHICYICGRTETVAHTWDEGTVIREASEEAPGEVLYTCTQCGFLMKQELPYETESETETETETETESVTETETETASETETGSETETELMTETELLPPDSGNPAESVFDPAQEKTSDLFLYESSLAVNTGDDTKPYFMLAALAVSSAVLLISLRKRKE